MGDGRKAGADLRGNANPAVVGAQEGSGERAFVLAARRLCCRETR